jgi:phage repressor protein C with HTH and peptisase S24 domain
MTTKERLKLFVQEKGFGQNAFEKEVQIAKGYIASKCKSITSDTIEKVHSRFPDLNLNWLLTGEGQPNKYRDTNEYRGLFHYTSFDSFRRIIKNGQFITSCFSKFNDYKEKKEYIQKEYPNEPNTYRYISLCAYYDENQGGLIPPMWHNYADNYKGVCIRFNKEKLVNKCRPVKHGTINYRHGVSYIDKLKEGGHSILDYLMTKDYCWNFEHEYRIICNEEDVCIDISDCIEAVTFGSNVDYDDIDICMNSFIIKELYKNRHIFRLSPGSDGKLHASDYRITEKLNKEGFVSQRQSHDKNKTPVVFDEKIKGSIPYYNNLPVSAGRMDLAQQTESEEPSGYMLIPNVSAERLLPVVGCSMEPKIKAGDIVGVNTVNNWDRVEPDKIYMIITKDDRMIKRLRVDDKDDSILWCVSDNYKEFKIYKDEIIHIFHVVYHGEII